MKPSSYLDDEILIQFVILNTLTKLTNAASLEKKDIYFSVARDLLNHVEDNMLEDMRYITTINLSSKNIEVSKNLYKTAISQIADSMEVKISYNPEMFLVEKDQFILKFISTQEMEEAISSHPQKLLDYFNALESKDAVIILENPFLLSYHAKNFLNKELKNKKIVFEYASDLEALKSEKSDILFPNMESFGFKNEINDQLQEKITRLRKVTSQQTLRV